MDLSNATDQELLAEVTARLSVETQLPDGLIKPMPAKVPDWMRNDPYQYVDGHQFGGDAAGACGPNFHWMMGQRNDVTARISIICPTFLRGPLSFNVHSGAVGKITFGASY